MRVDLTKEWNQCSCGLFLVERRTVREPWMAMARQTSSVEWGKDMVTKLARRFMVVADFDV